MQDRALKADTREALSRRRVLIVTDSLANGGMERQLTLLAKALATTWAVRVVSLTDGPYAEKLLAAGIDLTVLARSFRLDLRQPFVLGKLILEWRPEVVHAFGYLSMSRSMLPCRSAGIPIVDGSIRSGVVLPTEKEWLRRAMTARADVVIANSKAGLDAYGVDPARGRVVHNAFDPDRWNLCATGTREEGRPTTVVMTGRMHPHKDYRSLLDAARILCADDQKGWRFLAVGSGEQRPALQSEYRDLIESGAVSFPNAGTEALGFVSEADIGVLLTNTAVAAEGLSNSIMEYMACGLPVVCTDAGGNRELVIDGETGLFVPPADVDAVVRQLRFLADDPAAAGRMGRAGKERIATEFTVEALVRETVAAYDLAEKRH